MDLARGLLSQAHHLANLDARKPKQANLRRAVSSAYYAVFHLLCTACVRRISPQHPTGLPVRIARAMAHGEMREACRDVLKTTLPAPLREVQPTGFSAEIKLVAENFIKLQDQRHEADYDLALTYNRANVFASLVLADDVFACWRNIRDSDEANVFLAALLFGKRWSR